MAWLFHVSKGSIKKQFELPEGEITIGRDPINQIVLDHASVSRIHARIDYKEGFYTIRDLNSSWGVTVNDEVVKMELLQNNDRIRLGEITLYFAENEEMLNMAGIVFADGKFKAHYLDALSEKVRSLPELSAESMEAILKGAIDEMFGLYSISQAITSVLNLDQVLNLVLDKMFEFIGGDRGFIVLEDPDTGTLVPKLIRDIELNNDSGMRISRTIVKKVLEKGEPFLTIDAKTDSRVKDTESVVAYQITTVMCVPLLVKGKPIGAIYMEGDSPRAGHSQRKLTFLNMLANQAAIAIHNALIYEQLERAHQELIETQAHLIQSGKMAAIGQMASAIAHELNNPLSAVQSMLQVISLSMKKGDADLGAFKNRIEIALESCESLSDITSNLLEFASSRKDYLLLDVNLELAKAASLMRVKLQKTKVELLLDLAEEKPYIQGNRGQIRQVFLNLIINAMQAMEGGGKLTISSRKEDGLTAIRFRDEGQGIPEEMIGQIFTPFFTTKSEGKGTGLGLYICQKIIGAHKGYIQVQSAEGQGSVFIVKLPAPGSPVIG